MTMKIDEISKKVGNLIKEKRKGKKTLREISAETDISVGHLSEVERGEASISLDRLLQILNVLGVKFSTFAQECEFEFNSDEQTTLKKKTVESFSRNDLEEIDEMLKLINKGKLQKMLHFLKIFNEVEEAYVNTNFKEDLVPGHTPAEDQKTTYQQEMQAQSV